MAILNDKIQINAFTFLMFPNRNEEYWDPTLDGLEPIVVKRNIPCVHILMSLDEIDSKTPGYAKAFFKCIIN